MSIESISMTIDGVEMSIKNATSKQLADIFAAFHKEVSKLGNEREQNSLIERKELTGSDLCRAMLERGDKIVTCAVSDTSDADALEGDIYDAITLYKDGRTNPFESSGDIYMCAVPVNNQGEPLTQSEVGL